MTRLPALASVLGVAIELVIHVIFNFSSLLIRCPLLLVPRRCDIHSLPPSADCVIGSRLKVHPCRKGWRVLERIVTAPKGHGCTVRRHRSVKRCEGCDMTDRAIIGACMTGRRRVEIR